MVTISLSVDIIDTFHSKESYEASSRTRQLLFLSPSILYSLFCWIFVGWPDSNANNNFYLIPSPFSMLDIKLSLTIILFSDTRSSFSSPILFVEYSQQILHQGYMPWQSLIVFVLLAFNRVYETFFQRVHLVFLIAVTNLNIEIIVYAVNKFYLVIKSVTISLFRSISFSSCSEAAEQTAEVSEEMFCCYQISPSVYRKFLKMDDFQSLLINPTPGDPICLTRIQASNYFLFSMYLSIFNCSEKLNEACGPGSTYCLFFIFPILQPSLINE